VPPLLWVDDHDDVVDDDDDDDGERMHLMAMMKMTSVSSACDAYARIHCFSYYEYFRMWIWSTTTHWRWIVFSQFFGDDAWIYHVCVYESCFCWNS
jgi:hypothetical protein